MKQHRLAHSIHSSKAVIEVTLTILGFISNCCLQGNCFLFLLLILLYTLNETAYGILQALLGVL